jgi:hypothetical protein
MLAALRWWTSRGPLASDEKDEHCKLLRLVCQRWGERLLHIAGSRLWQQSLVGSPARLAGAVYRALSDQVAPGGCEPWSNKPPGKSGAANGVWPRARSRDAGHHCTVEGSVLFFPVTHPDYPDWPLTLVICHSFGGNPW